MSFTDGNPWIATEADCKARWGGRKNGDGFHCRLCGLKFVPGDTVRWQYLNDSGPTGNVLVCKKCDGTKDEIRAKAMAHIESITQLRRMGWIE